PNLFKVNLANFEVTKLDRSAFSGASKDWVIDAQGEIAFTLDRNDDSGVWKLRNAAGETIRQGRQRAGGISLIGLNFDGSKAIYRERSEDRTSYWYEIGQAGGEPTPFLDKVDFERLFFDPQTGHLMGYTEGEDEEERHVFANKELQKKAEAVRKAFSTYESWMSDWTADLDTVIVRTSGNGDSGTYYTVDLDTNRATALAYERNNIYAEQVGTISTFAYTARDGLEMDGILTLPPGAEPKNLPVIMLPHGGPHSQDRPTFDWWAQAFASRGYAVFQPNFRGSTNRDAAFRIAGYGEWGRKMQTDKTDGLMALAEAGLVDPSRACIVGGSYGGYAALAGVTIEQGIYKCAVAVAPVSDIRAMYNEDYQATGRERTAKVALRQQLGDPSLWNEVSPRRLADQADAPIMLIHGVDDTVVPYSHSTKMADKLKDADKPYELVTLAGEDHWLSLSVTRQQMLANAVRWVETHNPTN
ncbi:MAG: prolyl oligopeptidase family serine peptidase, partial [Pseudomonadota bacterium]